MTAPRLGSLTWLPATEHPELLGAPVTAALPALPGSVWVAQIDDDLADTAAFTEAYGVPPEASANCVVVAARRAGVTTLAACLVLATTRADVNGLVRRHLGARKASFAPQDVAVAETGMAYGGITPIGLPADWPVLVDAAVAAADLVVVGSGTRGSKLALSGAVVAGLPGAEVLEGLGQPITEAVPPSTPPSTPPSVLPAAPVERAPDDRDVGWGDRPPEDDDRRYLENRPPHWGSD
jgi:prolyl-tRNA editing enzyme YbaK/EbsC (Cys-tRNA(Pro) deacylase)